MGQATSRDSARMLSILGVLAYTASMMTHEGLGHGGYCFAAGGHNVVLTAWWETCKFSGTPTLGIKAAGPGMQFGAGLVAWLMLHLVSATATRLRFFLWLYMVFDLLVCSGYIAFSGLTDSGDAAELIAGLHPAAVWRGGLILLGSVVYFLSMLVAASELRRFAGLDDGLGRLFRLVWIPYFSAGVFACCTGVLTQGMGHGTAAGLATASPALDRTMGHGAAIGLAALSSFGAGSGMFGLPTMRHRVASGKSSLVVHYLEWSRPWGLFAAMVVVLFVVFIGPGLR